MTGMESKRKQTKLVKRLASISFDMTGVAVSSSATDPGPVLPPRKKMRKKAQLTRDAARVAIAPAPAMDSCCSRGRENSDASDCESDCQVESSSLAADCGLEDDALKRVGALALDEVVERRARRMRRLMKLYRAQYWGLLEEMRTKYRRFYLRHGKSGWRDDDAEEGEATGDACGEGTRVQLAERAQAELFQCRAQGCAAKPLPLSVFCLAHILLEPRQHLYKPCSYKNASAECGKPVLRAVVPPLCAEHFRVAQRQANRSLNRVLPGGVKYNPKLHLIVSQYVRVIQSKRRTKQETAAASASLEASGNEPMLKKS